MMPCWGVVPGDGGACTALRAATVAAGSAPEAAWLLLRLSWRLSSLALGSNALPNLDDITVRIAHVAADLRTMVLWLSEEFGSLAPPLFIAGPDVGDAKIEEAGHLMWVLRGTKRHGRFIIGGT